jgi:transcriptional regulator with XRE-family HTH domain
MTLMVDRLRVLREQHGWSQRELARNCGIAESVIRRYESGTSEPSTASLKLIAEQLDVSADYLLGMTDQPRGHLGDAQVADEEKARRDPVGRRTALQAACAIDARLASQFPFHSWRWALLGHPVSGFRALSANREGRFSARHCGLHRVAFWRTIQPRKSCTLSNHVALPCFAGERVLLCDLHEQIHHDHAQHPQYRRDQERTHDATNRRAQKYADDDHR